MLASAYINTNAEELERCLESIEKQSTPADEVVLVYDGPVDSSVIECVRSMKCVLPISTIALSKNQGLGSALSVGLDACTHEFVARVDTDDQSMSTRFEVQQEFLGRNPGVSVVGGAMVERYPFRGQFLVRKRNGPLGGAQIRTWAKKRNPLNHPTVMFRKSHLLSVGGYLDCKFFEDYHLWARLLLHGHSLANLDEVVVETVIGDGFFERRGGINYLFSEMRFLSDMLELGFMSFWEAVGFAALRLPTRLMPLSLRKRAYTHCLRIR